MREEKKSNLIYISMAKFQKSVTYVTVIIFLAFMALIAVMMMKAKGDQIFPANVPPCPDYYEVQDDGSCKNVKGLGNGSCSDPAVFEAQKYKGTGSRKAKCEYAKKCGVEWDGITNVGLC